MNELDQIPEIRALRGGSGLIRIPNQLDIPVTKRVLRLIDSPSFQRLSDISQLGVVNLVYPAANHHRFEHSLGVYRNALLFLQHFATIPRFQQIVSIRQATALIVAALLHDIGHWPFCHPIEDMQLADIPDHERQARDYIENDPIASLLKQDWQLEPADVLAIILRKKDSQANRLLCSLLSGPIDIDKMDYLYRDSLHAGVPYGQNFDAPRLIRSLCLNESGDQLAITRKGRTAAELMVVARYVMFSEVYWHHAVRSATAMFQRAFYAWNLGQTHETRRALFGLTERAMIQDLTSDLTAQQRPEKQLLDSIFGPQRGLFKRLASYRMDDQPTIYSRIAQQPYPWLVQRGNRLAVELSRHAGRSVAPHEVLLDAPPVGLEVQFDLDVFDQETGRYRRLGDLSPLVNALAKRQFDDFVKQVRVFVSPQLKQDLNSALKAGNMNIDTMLLAAIDDQSEPG